VEIAIAILGALVVILVLVFIVGTLLGRRLPVSHTASRTARSRTASTGLGRD